MPAAAHVAESLARHPQNGDLIPNEMKPYLSPPSGEIANRAVMDAAQVLLCRRFTMGFAPLAGRGIPITSTTRPEDCGYSVCSIPALPHGVHPARSLKDYQRLALCGPFFIASNGTLPGVTPPSNAV